MKKIRLTIGSQRFVIDECDGAAEIRFEVAPKVDADRRCAALVRLDASEQLQAVETGHVWLDLEVELIE